MNGEHLIYLRSLGGAHMCIKAYRWGLLELKAGFLSHRLWAGCSRCGRNRQHTPGKELTAVPLLYPGSGEVVGSGVRRCRLVIGEPLSRPRSKGAKMRIKAYRWSLPKSLGPSCKHRLTVACPTATAHDRERGRARSPHRSQSAVFVFVDQGGGLPPGMVCA